MTTPIPATLIPGDGIGPEIVDAALAALDALRAPFEWDRQVAGLAGVQAAGDPLPPATLASIRRTRLALKGPLETPSGSGYRSSNVRLREEFQLYANLRPARTIIPGGRFDNIDLVVVRENIDTDAAIFEAVHGSAPDIAGKGIANPIALLLAAGLMLDHCKLPELATRLRKAIDETVNIDQVRTGDLGGSAGTAALTQALVSRITSG